MYAYLTHVAKTYKKLVQLQFTFLHETGDIQLVMFSYMYNLSNLCICRYTLYFHQQQFIPMFRQTKLSSIYRIMNLLCLQVLCHQVLNANKGETHTCTTHIITHISINGL